MGHFDFDDDDLIKMLDEIAVKVPEKVPEAVDAMTNYIRPRLIMAAPVDYKYHKSTEKHLWQVISRTNVRRTRRRNGHYATIFVNPRGIPGATIGPRAKANWAADKYVFKLVVREFGSSTVAPKPFWQEAVDKGADTAMNIGAQIILNEVDKCGK